jgi:hypothetical protein
LFASTVESLQGFECPAWFRDAKFGIWSHWGPQSVPMYGGGSERAVIQALGRVNEKQIASAHVPGRPVEFVQKDGALLVGLPGGIDRTMPVCIKAAFKAMPDRTG